MQHLDDQEPCRRSELFKTFRSLALAKFQVQDTKTKPHECLVTVISRRNYQGRVIQRRWLNEDEVVAQMRVEYPECVFQSVDFVDLSLKEQMEIVKESDMVIGMHGAGMVNVLWSREGTRVIEIFPKRRFRWGYRNLCQFVGCEWVEFRGGEDTGKGDNASDKTIPYEEWKAFFDPIFKSMVAALNSI